MLAWGLLVKCLVNVISFYILHPSLELVPESHHISPPPRYLLLDLWGDTPMVAGAQFCCFRSTEDQPDASIMF